MTTDHAHSGSSEVPYTISPEAGSALPEAVLKALADGKRIVAVDDTSECPDLEATLAGALARDILLVRVAAPQLSPDTLLANIAASLGLTIPTSAFTVPFEAIREGLAQHLARGQRLVVLVDEATALPAATRKLLQQLTEPTPGSTPALQSVFLGKAQKTETAPAPSQAVQPPPPRRLPWALVATGVAIVATAVWTGRAYQRGNGGEMQKSVAIQPAKPSAEAPLQPVAPHPAAKIRFGPLTRQHLAQFDDWIEAAPSTHYFIQLLSTDATRTGQIEGFIARAASELDPALIRAYRSSLSGRDRVGVIYGDFASREEAVVAMQQLPDSIKAAQPFPRQVSRLR